MSEIKAKMLYTDVVAHIVGICVTVTLSWANRRLNINCNVSLLVLYHQYAWNLSASIYPLRRWSEGTVKKCFIFYSKHCFKLLI